MNSQNLEKFDEREHTHTQIIKGSSMHYAEGKINPASTVVTQRAAYIAPSIRTAGCVVVTV